MNGERVSLHERRQRLEQVWHEQKMVEQARRERAARGRGRPLDDHAVGRRRHERERHSATDRGGTPRLSLSLLSRAPTNGNGRKEFDRAH